MIFSVLVPYPAFTLDGRLHFEVRRWLEEYIGKQGDVASLSNFWDVVFTRSGSSDCYRFSFKRRVDAMLFKLTWT